MAALQQKRGTAAAWTATNPVLAAGEIGVETDTGSFKIGDGSTSWSSLAYAAQKVITSGTAAPTGGSSGDIYLRYT
jgi:hypothetical protein